jgi:hypothetical protein
MNLKIHLAHHIPKLRSNFAEFLRYCCSNVLACDASPSVVNFSTVLRPELRFLALRGNLVDLRSRRQRSQDLAVVRTLLVMTEALSAAYIPSSLSHGDSCAPLGPIVSSVALFVLGAEINTGTFTVSRQTLGYDDSNHYYC